jgi:hypothetical protein
MCSEFCANFGKSATEILTMISQAFGEERMCQRDKDTILPMEKLTETEKDETGKEKSQEHAHPFL